MVKEQITDSEPPKLARRRENRNSTFKLGRTIGAKREKLETANERAAARKKDKQKKTMRVVMTVAGFLAIAIILAVFFKKIIIPEDSQDISGSTYNFKPTVEIIDEATMSSNSDKITSRMVDYIGRAERDFRDLGYNPIKVIFPSNAIREVDFYLDGYSGFIKLTIDRDSAISAEDADRMLRYLSEKGISDFTYIDVRIDGKAYWK
ncbi:hypothetical protein IJI29_03805 [Candidatus Saccharibacteria bacterium]|nr:hypothetical protein [Candidatus Saccharibacteria bacterium]